MGRHRPACRPTSLTERFPTGSSRARTPPRAALPMYSAVCPPRDLVAQAGPLGTAKSPRPCPLAHEQDRPGGNPPVVSRRDHQRSPWGTPACKRSLPKPSRRASGHPAGRSRKPVYPGETVLRDDPPRRPSWWPPIQPYEGRQLSDSGTHQVDHEGPPTVRSRTLHGQSRSRGSSDVRTAAPHSHPAATTSDRVGQV
jgi:hypothetical protein